MYQSKKCNASYSEYKELHKHKLSHEKPLYICKFCGQTYSSRSYYGIHVKSHHNENKIHQCEMCNQSFTKWIDFRRHIISHNTSQIVCELCGMSYSTKSSFDTHYRKDHGEKFHLCDICQKTFIKLSDFHKHEKSHSTHLFICNVCGKSFKARSSYYYHIRKHPEMKPHTCPICDKSFSSASELHNHKQYHGTHAYACKFCDCSFIAKSSYDYHLGTHKWLRSCVVCNKLFDSGSIPTNHDAGKKNYQCPTCIKTIGHTELTNHPAELCSQTRIKEEVIMEISFQEKDKRSEQSHQPVEISPETKIKEEALHTELIFEEEQKCPTSQTVPDVHIKKEGFIRQMIKNWTNQPSEYSTEIHVKEEEEICLGI